MWEAIEANRRRSLWLISLMGALLVVLGALVGLTVVLSFGYYEIQQSDAQELPPFWQQVLDAQAGIWFGIAVALVIWFIMWISAITAGDSILLRSAKAREISKEDAPQLWNVVEEMTIASGMGKMPRVFIIDDSSLNAFAVGYKQEKCAVAVTAGLLKRLNRDELQGVIAHEIGHIRNQDVKFMTTAGVMVGAIVLMSHIFLRGMFYSGGGRRRSSRGGGGYAQLIILAIAILMAIIAPIAAQMLYYACSRRREFLADASSARFTRYPPGLASALEKISRRSGMAAADNKVIAPMCIVNPLQSRAAFSLFSTHPKTEERIQILRSMGGAGFAAYEEAFRKAQGEKQHCIGERTLAQDEQVGLREPTPEPQRKEDAVQRAEEVERILDHVLPFAIIACACGVRLKLPPNFKRDQLKCPRCGRAHSTSEAKKPDQRDAAASGGPKPPMRYRRKGTGWETFQCSCGHPIQLSPKFSASWTDCPKCGQHIDIVGQ